MRRFAQFVFVLLFSMLLPATAVQAQKRVALVIGNSAYQHAGLLDNPKNDAMMSPQLSRSTDSRSSRV